MSQPPVDGLVVVDKPAGCTSHDVVGRCRKIFGQKRVGHGGTLDPDATGVLLVGLGRATRLLRFLGPLPKSYVAEVVLGVETTTLDDGGEVVATHEMSGVGLGDVRTAAARFVGDIEQIPPMVSAVSVGGRRLHELARAGVEVERAARPVTVHRFEVSPGSDPGVYRIEVDCSSGTYVRSLAADLGTALGGGAHLRRLRRTAVGPFAVEQAVPLEWVGPADVLPAAAAVRHLPAVSAGADLAEAVSYGKVLDVDWPGEGPWAVLDGAGELLAVYERYGDGRAKPSVVLAPH
ncbi:MAG TPA: tRNA pseudouridine(55) synthase TruB [Acidimicrobiales bacterium]|nr:tRNA pseudouridine(55) synthase TruB [Acidimicrobiales bacterium]